MSECRISLALTVSILLWGNVPPDGFFSLSCHRRARSSVCLRDKSAACYNLGSINRKKFVSSAKKTGKNLGQMVLSWAASKFSVLMRTTRRGQVFQCRSLVRGSWDQHPDGAKPLLTSHFSSPELRVSEDLSVLARLPFTSCAPGTGGPWATSFPSAFLKGNQAWAVPFPAAAWRVIGEWLTHCGVSCQPLPSRLSKNFNLF